MAEAQAPADMTVQELSAPMTMTESQTRGEIDIQINTAKRFPRDIQLFLRKAETLATLNDDIAASCFYKLKRRNREGGDSFIEGPTVRLAEIVASAYGNMRIDARTINEDDKFVYAQGLAWDLEENVAIRYEVRRRISDSKGKKYSDDMIGVTANAATAIALRNAAFRVIPRSLWEGIYEKAKAVAAGTQETLAVRRQKTMEYFTQKLGVPKEKVFKHLEIEGLESMTLQHIETLRGIATAIKEGDTSIDAEFGDKREGGPAMPREKTPEQQAKPTPEPRPAPAEQPPHVDEQQATAFERSNGENRRRRATDIPPASEPPAPTAPPPSTDTVESLSAEIQQATAETWDSIKGSVSKRIGALPQDDQLKVTFAINRRMNELFLRKT